MRLRTLFILVVLSAVALVLSCCSVVRETYASLPQEAKKTIMEALMALLQSGTITQEQFDMVVRLLTGQGSTDFLSKAGEILGIVGSSVVASLFGVRAWRGGINARKGKTD